MNVNKFGVLLAAYSVSVLLVTGCRKEEPPETTMEEIPTDTESRSDRNPAREVADVEEPAKSAHVDTESVDAAVRQEQYERVDPQDLSFTIKDYYYEAMIGEGGEAIPIGGEIGALLCGGRNIELASHRFENGFIVTKDHGDIRIRFGASLVDEGACFWLKPSQKKAFAALVKGAEENPG